jgi:hypothetical protein
MPRRYRNYVFLAPLLVIAVAYQAGFSRLRLSSRGGNRAETYGCGRCLRRRGETERRHDHGRDESAVGRAFSCVSIFQNVLTPDSESVYATC